VQFLISENSNVLVWLRKTKTKVYPWSLCQYKSLKMLSSAIHKIKAVLPSISN
jgi:hypothetical protein